MKTVREHFSIGLLKTTTRYICNETKRLLRQRGDLQNDVDQVETMVDEGGDVVMGLIEENPDV